MGIKAGRRPQGPPTSWGHKAERVPCREWNLEVVAIPPQIALRSEIKVSTESINKVFILSRDRDVSSQQKVAGPTVAWQAMDPGTGTLRNTWSPSHYLPSLLLSPPY